MKKVKKQKIRLKKYQPYINKKVAGICAMTILVSTVLGPLATSANTENNNSVSISSDSEAQIISGEEVSIGLEDMEEEQANVEEVTPEDEQVQLEEVTSEEEPKEEATPEQPKEEATPEQPKEETTPEQPKEEPAPEEPKEEPKEEPAPEEEPEEEATPEEPKEEATPEEPKEEPAPEEEPKEEATPEEPKEEPAPEEEPKEEATPEEEPKEEETPEQPTEEDRVYTINLNELAENSGNNTLPFPVTVRDFKADGILFEGYTGTTNKFATPDVVSGVDSNGNPILSMDGMKYLIEEVCNNAATKYHTDGICNNGTPLSFDPDNNDDKIKFETAETNYKALENKTYSEAISLIKNNYQGDPYLYVLYHFNKLFDTVDGLNQYRSDFTQLNLQGDNGFYQYNADWDVQDDGTMDQNYINTDSKFFFPINSNSFGNQLLEDSNGKLQNFNFTLESHTKFWFDGTKKLEFEFKGDDDVWVFLDGHQVIDLGGPHRALTQKFIIDTDGTISIQKYTWDDDKDNEIAQEPEEIEDFTLTDDGWYDFDFFYIERHTNESNLMISTNIVFAPLINLEKIAYRKIDGAPEQVLSDDSIVYPGEKIYYKFRISNQGNVDITNVTLVDNLINLSISLETVVQPDNPEREEHVVRVNGQKIDTYSITKQINNGEPQTTTLEELKKLDYKTKAWLEIESPSFYYEVTQNDLEVDSSSQKPILSNTATVSGNYTEFGTNKLVENKDTIQLEVRPTVLNLRKLIQGNTQVKDTFFINISGYDDNDTTTTDDDKYYNYNIPVISNNGDVVINVLNCGVQYTISEIVPMNYSLVSINNNTNNNYQFEFSYNDIEETVIITNKQGPNKWFKDDDLEKNIFDFSNNQTQ